MSLPSFIKRLNGRSRMLLIIFSSIIALVIYFIAYNHIMRTDSYRQEVLNRLKAISCTTALHINGDLHQKLTDRHIQKDVITTNLQDSIYLVLHQQLREVAEVNKVTTPIYTMVYEPLGNHFEFIVTSAINPYFRHTLDKYPSSLLLNYERGGISDTYQDEYGEWLSAFAPIKNKNEEVVAVVQVDQNFSEFAEEARFILFRNIAIGLIVLVPFSGFLYAYIDNSLKDQDEYAEKLEEKNEEIVTQSEIIKTNHKQLEKAKLALENKNRILDKQVALRTQQLSRTNEELSTFLYQSSHDVQGPIASIKGLCNMAKMEGEGPNSYIDFINKEINTLSDRVKSISRIHEIKDKEVKRGNFNLYDLVNRVKELNNNKIAQYGIDFDINMAEDLQINTDKAMLELVLNELVQNSIHYRNESLKPRNSINASRAGSEKIIIIVDDNGLGIEKELEKEIFKMFKRANEKSKGAGLGLYAVKLALKKLQGKIRLKAKTSAGTQFQITIHA